MIEEDAAEHLAGECLDSRFELNELVARGGHALVYRGVHRGLRCPIAVKLLSVGPDMDAWRPKLIAQFENEARTVAALRHPAIVRVLDHGVASCNGGSLPYLVLEWVDGETLESSLRGASPRAPREALSLLRPVFDAIAFAHSAGVVHRDIKPSNIMVSRGANGERALQVLDFGISKMMLPDELVASGDTKTTDDVSSFSLSHAAPEQVARMRTGPWTDVHSLALLLVEVLVGERAYRAADNVELFSKITATERPTPVVFGRRVGPWEDTLRRALSVNRHERPADAAALLRALDEGLDEAQRAWETPAPALVTRGSKRRAAIVSAAAMACALGGAALWRARSTATPVVVSAVVRTTQPDVSAAAVAVEPARVSEPRATPTHAASAPSEPTSRAPTQRRAAPRTGARARDGRSSLIDDEVVVQ